MDTSFPATMMASLEVFRQHVPAQHFAYVRGDVWALVQDRIGHIGSMEFAVPYIERLRLGKL